MPFFPFLDARNAADLGIHCTALDDARRMLAPRLRYQLSLHLVAHAIKAGLVWSGRLPTRPRIRVTGLLPNGESLVIDLDAFAEVVVS